MKTAYLRSLRISATTAASAAFSRANEMKTRTSLGTLPQFPLKVSERGLSPG